MDPVIEQAQPADLPAILALLERAHLPTMDIQEHLNTTLVARTAGGVVGSAALEIYGSLALLRSVAVDPAAQGQGLGQQLTQAALRLAQQRGMTQVYLLTETAADFFPRFGFQPTTRSAVPAAVQQSVEFREACPASALVMVAELPGAAKSV